MGDFGPFFVERITPEWGFYAGHGYDQIDERWYAYVKLFDDLRDLSCWALESYFDSKELAINWVSEQEDKIFN